MHQYDVWLPDVDIFNIPFSYICYYLSFVALSYKMLPYVHPTDCDLLCMSLWALTFPLTSFASPRFVCHVVSLASRADILL